MILVINDYPYIQGGASKVAILQARQLADSNKKVLFFSIQDGLPDQRLLHPNIKIEFFRASNIRLIKLMLMVFNPFALLSLQKLIKIYRNDLEKIFIHSWTKTLSPSVFLSLRGLTTHFFLHDYFIKCPNGGLHNYNLESHCDLKPMSLKCLKTNCDKDSYFIKVLRFIRHLIFKSSMKLIQSKFIFLSKHQQEILKLSGEVIKNKIDIVEIPNELKQTNSFVYVGRLDPEKGIKQLVDVIASSNLSINIIGDGKYFNYKASGDIIYHGWLPSDSFLPIVSSSRYAVFPSIWYEVDPLTPWEIMSLGVPVISSIDNLFGLYFKDYFPELVYSNDLKNKIDQLNNLDYQELSNKVKIFAIDEIQKRNNNWALKISDAKSFI